MSSQFSPRLRVFQPAALTARFQQSLFAIPFLCLILGGALAELMIRLDRSGRAGWLPDSYETSAENGRAVLGAIATGTITVVTLVLTLTLVAIQLAAGQLSPRTIANFLGDRVQQITVGVVLGTATYSLIALRSLRVAQADDLPRPPDLTVFVAVALTVVSLVLLVLSVDRTASRLAVGTLVRDLATETTALIESNYGESESAARTELPGRVIDVAEPTWSAGATISADRPGWVQHIDEKAMVSALPPNAAAHLLHPVGTFVMAEMVLVEVDADNLDEEQAQRIRKAIVVGDKRTMQQDVSFGLTRLVDIGLRALSPGVNDPNTAREVILRLGQVVLTLQAHELPGAESEVDGHRMVRERLPTHGDFVRSAYDQLRRAAEGDRAVLETLHQTLTTVRAEAERRSLPGPVDELERQSKLVEQALSRLAERGAADRDWQTTSP